MSISERLRFLAQQSQEIFQKLQRLYTQISLDVRFSYAEHWFDSKHEEFLNISQVPPEQRSSLSQQFLEELLNCLKEAEGRMQADFLRRNQVTTAYHSLESFRANSENFLFLLHSLAKEENEILIGAFQQDQRMPHTFGIESEENIDQGLQKLNEMLRCQGGKIQSFSDSQEQLRIFMQGINEEISKLEKDIATTDDSNKRKLTFIKETKEFDRKTKATKNCQERQQLLAEYKSVLSQMAAQVNKVWQEIGKWLIKRKKAIFTVTESIQTQRFHIDQLDRLCCLANEAILQAIQNSQQLKYCFALVRYQNASSMDPVIIEMEEESSKLYTLLEEHLAHAFIVDHGPEQIIKIASEKSHMFEVSCMILGGKSLQIGSQPRVTAQLFTETDLPSVLADKGNPKTGICDVQNGKNKPMSYNRTKEQWTCYFSSVQLQKVKRPKEKTDPEKLVTENMHVMVFYTSIKVCDREYKLATASLPMVLISHVMQHWQAKATLIWDAAFSTDDPFRKTFEHTDRVIWRQVADVLNKLFQKDTGKGLTEEHLNYLGRTALRRNSDVDSLDTQPVAKNQLVREKIQKDLTFWKWFMACLNLIREHLSQEWLDGLIYGFISKPDVESKLLTCPNGTFILRFSERDFEKAAKADVCGCLTLAVTARNPRTNNNQVIHVKEHMRPVEISRHKLMNILNAFDVSCDQGGNYQPLLHYLYPNQSFPEIYENFNKNSGRENGQQPDANGYHEGRMKIHLDLFGRAADAPGTPDPPGTPHTMTSEECRMEDDDEQLLNNNIGAMELNELSHMQLLNGDYHGELPDLMVFTGSPSASFVGSPNAAFPGSPNIGFVSFDQSI